MKGTVTELEPCLDEAWEALTGGAGTGPRRPHLNVTGHRGHLPSRFGAQDVAVACIGVALGAGSTLGGGTADLTLDRSHAAAAVTSERWFARDGRSTGVGFAPLSKFWRAGDGWVRTHANYPWHRDALLHALGVPDDADRVASAIAARGADEVQEAVFHAGGVAAAVRTFDEWRVHPQGVAVSREPLIGHQVAGDARARRPAAAEPSQPARGVRVLDLTRVIAGPVCTRLLGALGAAVLRIDPPQRFDMRPDAPSDSLLGKRSAFLDLRTAGGGDRLHELLDAADVVVCGYRPGALEPFGLDPGALAERHPGLVAVYLDAWGHTGPWRDRRGFDSVVQAPSGIAMGESADGAEPGSLPCQLLDHGTGYLSAAAVLDGLRRQRELGGTHVRRLSLARTAWWVACTDAGDGGLADPEPGTPWLVELQTRDAGSVVAVAPPGRVGDEPLGWPSPVSSYGADQPEWPSDPTQP